MAVCAIVMAIEAERSLWASNSALAGTAPRPPIISAQQSIDLVDIVPPNEPPCCGLRTHCSETFRRSTEGASATVRVLPSSSWARSHSRRADAGFGFGALIVFHPLKECLHLGRRFQMVHLPGG